MIDANHDMPNSDIVLRAANTNIQVIQLHNLHRESSNIWIDVGTPDREIDITSMFLQLLQRLVLSTVQHFLVSMHTLAATSLLPL